ncbi:hypothetical protein KFU94_12205 [Chloroflexi bacterium TSY]|nr:hypothetical protein [Chloroflexi bacterium TSY]
MLNQVRRDLLMPSSSSIRIGLLFVIALVVAGGSLPLPSIGDIFPYFAPPTATPTPTPSPTPTPPPTPTPRPGETPLPPTPTPVPTPQVSIPSGYHVVVDNQRGYSVGLPGGWTELDLRGAQITQLAGFVGQGEALANLQNFLDTETGQAIGIVAITDIGAAMFGGLPTLLNVAVVDAPGATPDSVLEFLEKQFEANATRLGNIQIQDMNTSTINNMPGIRASAVANLSNVGINASLFAKIAGLIANDKIYILTLATQESNRGTKEPEFDQIIGTFRPD